MRSYRFTNFTEFTTESSPSAVFTLLDEYRARANDKLELEINHEKKKIVVTDASKGLKLQIKFFKLPANPEEQEEGEEELILRFRIVKKQGTLEDQYELTKELLLYLSDIIIDDDEEVQL